MTGLPNLTYGGNHGLELEGRGFKITHAQTKTYRPAFEKMIKALGPLSKEFPGGFVEDKGIAITFHYRQVEPRLKPELRKAVFNRIEPWIAAKKVKVTAAKKAFEIRPNVNWTKGSAVQWLLLRENPESLPVYMGDDKTDESAF